jgi:molybdopterin molybdotransferase
VTDPSINSTSGSSNLIARVNKPLQVFEDAREQLIVAAKSGLTPKIESIDLMRSCGRVLANTVHSDMAVPPMDNSGMDGYALKLADVKFGPNADWSEPILVCARVPAGASPEPLLTGTAARIFTGAQIPAGADVVVMQERVNVQGDQFSISAKPALQVGEAIRCRGEDIQTGAPLVLQGQVLTPARMGLIASVGVGQLDVYKKLRVACFFTGDELTMPGQALRQGSIYNSSRFVLTAALASLGCEVIDLGIVPDTLAATQAALRQAAQEADLIVTSGGVSVGEEDHVKPAVLSMGRLDLWQINMKPGKPLAYGRVDRTDQSFAHFIGLPGNPVSSYVTFMLLARPFILALQGANFEAPRYFHLPANFDWPKPDKRREFLRVVINQQGALDLYRTQSSGALTSMAFSDGLIDVPPGTVIAKGQSVRFLPFTHLGA